MLKFLVENLQKSIKLNTVCAVPFVAILLTADTQGCLAACKAPTTDSTITTDRPTFANASTTVPCRAFQLETGLLVSYKAGQRGFDLPETSVRYGLSDRSELRLGAPNYYENYTAGSIPATGLGDLTFGEKQQLFLGRGGAAVAFVATLSLPTGAQAVSSHGYDLALQVPASAKVGAKTMVAGQLGIGWPTVDGRHDMTGQADLYVDQQLTRPLDAFLEYNGAFQQRGLPQHTIDLGGTFKVTAHQQVDIHAGFGLSSAVLDHFYGVGFSTRFGR